MTVNVRMKGLQQLDKALQQFPARVQKRVAGNAIRSGARVVRSDIAARAARRTGELARSVVVRARRGFPGWAVIGFLKAVSWRVHFLEFGTRNMRARPFIRPGLSSAAQAAVRKTADATRRGVEREAAKLRQQQGRPR